MLVINKGHRRYSAYQFNDTYKKQAVATLSFQSVKDDMMEQTVDHCPQGHELRMINGMPRCMPMRILEKTSIPYTGFGLHIITNDKPYD